MPADDKALETINTNIGEHEDGGKAAKLAKLLAPRLAFQRADPKQTVDDQVAFLQKVARKKKTDSPRTTTISEPILYSRKRTIALVRCIVSQKGVDYHNFRLFVRRNKKWKLLGWANENLSSPG